MKDIAVFIPVYNGALYLERTLQSLRTQTYQNFTVYCVNDSSTDNSLELINAVAEKDSRFQVFTKQQGGSTAKSWNYILPRIQEHFIFYMSQDDLISPETLTKMMQRQQETDADCILPDMVLYHECGNNQESWIGIDGGRSAVLTGSEALQASLFWKIHGFAMRKKSLYNNEFFFEDAFDTDEYMTRKLFLKSNKVAFSEGIFFYRQDNPHAITKTFDKKNYFALLTYQRVYQLLFKDPALAENRKEWFDFMVNRYVFLLQNYNNGVGIARVEEYSAIQRLFRVTRKRLLIQMLQFGKFWTKAIYLKKLMQYKITSG